ncbi:MAG TPA: GFA family protein [Myxococcota bacterium]|nr:GFA family protein [Myxococcota bacterium]
MEKYRGSCHCGRVRFEVDLDLDHVRSCDCSICHRRGALLCRAEARDFRLLSPPEDLTLYQWHTRTAEDYFCSTCGILPFRRPRRRTAREIAEGVPEFSGWSINVRCLEGVALTDIPVVQIRGRELD